MKKLILTALVLSTLNAQALVKVKNNGVTSGNKKDFATIEEITDDKVVCIYLNKRYVPVTKKAVELAQGKTCRNIGRVGVDYVGINSTTRNSHLYESVLKAIN